MSLIEEYYELNEAEKVSAVWKVLQIGFYTCSACLGLGCGFTLAVSRSSFDDRCYLFTEVKASYSKDDKADQSSIIWENDSWCDYYQFTMVSSFIVATIWATFFLMCGKGGKSLTGLPQPWRIVWPSLIFNFMYFVIALSTAIGIQQGTDVFCGRNNFVTKRQVKSLLEKCEPLKILLKNKDLYQTSVQLEIVVKMSWGCVTSWLILFLLSFFRIVFVVDFHLYKICVFKIDDTAQNKKEEVLRITNYEEPKKLQNDKEEEIISDFEPEKSLEDLEASIRRKIKVDKKSMRQHFNTAYHFSPQPNATFYVMADLRMLKKKDKKVNYSHTFSESFRKNNLEVGLRKLINNKSKSNISGKSNIPIFSHQCFKELNKFTDNEEKPRPFSMSEKLNFEEGWSESGSKSDLANYSDPHFLTGKKEI